MRNASHNEGNEGAFFEVVETIIPTLRPQNTANLAANLGYSAALGAYAANSVGSTTLTGIRFGLIGYGVVAGGLYAYDTLHNNNPDIGPYGPAKGVGGPSIHEPDTKLPFSDKPLGKDSLPDLLKWLAGHQEKKPHLVDPPKNRGKLIEPPSGGFRTKPNPRGGKYHVLDKRNV